jgi:hypothetical protein
MHASGDERILSGAASDALQPWKLHEIHLVATGGLVDRSNWQIANQSVEYAVAYGTFRYNGHDTTLCSGDQLSVLIKGADGKPKWVSVTLT